MTNSRSEYLQQKDSCILTCDVVDGVCSSNAVSGKVSYKQLNCPKNQLCYVDETEEKLSSGNLTLADKGSFESSYLRFIDKDGLSKQKISKIVSINALDAINFERIKLNLWLTYLYI
jgi:hypothetical protein